MRGAAVSCTGEVHDENAYGLGGLAPHAGLFSTASSLAPFPQMYLNGGAYNARRIVNAETIEPLHDTR